MHTEKSRRQQVIVDVLNNENISSQEDLRLKLKALALDVTQATLSRDLRELGVIKTVTEEGVYRYMIPEETSPSPVVSCRSSGNLLVIKTLQGMAPAVAYKIDDLGMSEVLGTVAGEDTLFVVLAEGASDAGVHDRICKRLRSR